MSRICFAGRVRSDGSGSTSTTSPAPSPSSANASTSPANAMTGVTATASTSVGGRPLTTTLLFSASEDASKGGESPAATAASAAAARALQAKNSAAPASGGSWLSPRFSVDVCRRIDYSPGVVMHFMSDCSKYTTWWPKTYDFKVVKCNPDVVGSINHFNSLFGTYQTEVVRFTPLEMDLHYSGEIFEGYQHWEITPFSDGTCELCYRADLEPLTYKTRLAASVASRDYLASYFEPLVVSLVKELDRQHAVNVAERETHAAHMRQQLERARLLSHQIDHQSNLETFHGNAKSDVAPPAVVKSSASATLPSSSSTTPVAVVGAAPSPSRSTELTLRRMRDLAQTPSTPPHTKKTV